MLHALAYGARGVSYFAYWTPVDVEHADVMKFRHGLIEDRKPTRHYFEAMRLNKTVHTFARALEGFQSVAVVDYGGQSAPLYPGPIAAITGEPATVGFFEHATGRRVVLLVNRSYRNRIQAQLVLSAGASQPVRLNVNADRWETIESMSFPIDAGAAVLLRWDADDAPRR
jgi:hypothetical protein